MKLIERLKKEQESLQKAVQEKKPLPNITKAEAEKIILDFEDLLMKIVAFKGLNAYDVPEMLKNYRELKNNLKYAVEAILRAKKGTTNMDAVESKPSNDDASINVQSTKKYTFKG